MEGESEVYEPEEEMYIPGGDHLGSIGVEKQESEVPMEERVRGYARNFFEEIYNVEKIPFDMENEPFSPFLHIRKLLSYISGSEKEICNYQFTDDYIKAVEIFLKELTDFSIEKEKDSDGKNNDFCRKIGKMLFSCTPNIAEGLGFGQLFDFTSRTTRATNLFSNIGQNSIHETAYLFGWSDFPENDFEIIDSYNEGTIAEKLDKISLMQLITLAAVNDEIGYNNCDARRSLQARQNKAWENDEEERVESAATVLGGYPRSGSHQTLSMG